MKRVSIALLSLALFWAPLSVLADEGMWTFDNPPRKQWKEKYQFEPSDSWLEHVRLASVRLNDGGSGSFVSPNGLVVTNQHVASSQIAKLSSAERDIVRDGFYARTRAEELKCPDLEVNVLASFEDVTARVQGSAGAGASGKQAADQRRAAIAAIEKESTEKTGLRSEVVTLYSGGEYWLYRFKKYTDVRLVFAPEEQIAFFGGDYDNFTYPRHDLDFTFLRVYDNGQPLRTEHYFKWSEKGAAEGELIFVPGNPGSTSRLLTVSQIRYHRDVLNPVQMDVWKARRDALEKYAATNVEAARRANDALRSLENSMKRMVGQQEGLANARMMTKKEEEEKALLAELNRRPELKQAYAPAWDEVTAAYAQLPAMARRIAFSTLAPSSAHLISTSFGNPVSRLATIAAAIVRYAEETAKPNDKRYNEFRDSNLESLKVNIFSSAPIYPDKEEALLAAWLDTVARTLGPNDPFVRAALQGKTPAEVARAAVSGSQLTDVAARKSLVEGGQAAVAKSNDPMIQLARRVESVVRELRAWLEERIQSVETGAGQKIAAARFAVYGKNAYPDATFSLRLSYGRVLGYEEDTTLVPFKTTFFGLYDRAESFNEKPPYNLPQRYKERRQHVNMSTPLNFVYTADTIGGNSGSPIINRAGELVGLNFDSNIQKLPNRYWYVEEGEGGRAVGVHSAAIVEALVKVYGAENLVQEITGR